MSSQPRTRIDRRKSETRARILEAAVELFGEVGFDATKVADVCERADVARQTFFNHFPAKGDLLAELMRRGGDFISATLDSAYERGASTRERLALFFHDVIAATIEVGPSSRDLVAHVVHSRHDPDRSEQARLITSLLQGFVRRCVAGGDVTRRYAPAALAADALEVRPGER